MENYCNRAFVAIGSNQGKREQILQSAVTWIADGNFPATRFIQGSSIYETSPVGPAKACFLNAVFELYTNQSAAQLLACLLELEQLHGRVRLEHWGDRSLDLDLLFMQHHGEDMTIRSTGLSLPHPRICARDFVLAPWAEIAGEVKLGSYTVAQHLQRCDAHARTILRVLPIRLRPDSNVC